jgi:uncharacterized protein with PIN domain
MKYLPNIDKMHPIELGSFICEKCDGTLETVRVQSIINRLHTIKRCVSCGQEYYEKDILEISNL